MQKITKFYFVRAIYFLGDERGNEVLMTVDYKNNKFSLRGQGLEREAGVIARDLLARKHEVNFADRIKM